MVYLFLNVISIKLNNMKKYIFPFFALLLIVLAIVVIYTLTFGRQGTVKKQDNVPTNALPRLIVAGQPPSALDLASQIIIDKGWDKEQGFVLDLRTVFYEGTLTALTNNQVDILSMPPLSAVQYVNEQQPITFIAPGLKASCPFFVKPGNPAKSWRDLRGKKLGTTLEIGGSFTLFKVVMKAVEGIDVDKYFQVSHSATAELLPRLLRGEVDAAYGRCTEDSRAKAVEDLKFVEIGNITDVMKRGQALKELMLDGIVVKTEWLNKNKELVVKFRNLLYKTYDYIRTHPDEIYDNPKVQEAYGLKDLSPTVIAKTKELAPQYYTFVEWKEQVDMQYKFLEYAKDYGLIKTLPPKEQLFFYN